MVKFTRIGTSIYLLFVLYVVFYSQARCSDGKYTPDPNAPKPLSSINVPNAKLPPDWPQQARSADSYRLALKTSTADLIALPAKVPEGLKKLARLEARSSAAQVDVLLFAVSTTALQAHDRANYKVRQTPMRAGGVPIYASNRGSGSSSSSYSSHK
jgi:hypothetical protein